MEPFVIHQPSAAKVPIIVSVPHCGTLFPEEIKEEFDAGLAARPDDTDWFVDKLYDFAPSMGIEMITGVYSRWVIDLNRDPESKPLYTDGRIITGLCPVTSFKGEEIYVDRRKEVAPEEVTRRFDNYYTPYHKAIKDSLARIVAEHGKVLLWDCHSIRQYVPTIHPKKFPDLILGDNDGCSAEPFLTEMASKSLHTSGFSFENNYLFKGGYITRQYGQPEQQQHALQLEMTKVNYMDDSEINYDSKKAEVMRDHLKRMFEKLITVLII